MHTGTQSWFSQPKRFPRTAFQNSTEGKRNEKTPTQIKDFWLRLQSSQEMKLWFDGIFFSHPIKNIWKFSLGFLVFFRASGDMGWCGDGAPYWGMTPLRSSSSCRPTWGGRARPKFISKNSRGRTSIFETRDSGRYLRWCSKSMIEKAAAVELLRSWDKTRTYVENS